MKILSFDIGIKNLAFCLLDSNHLTIEDWGIINISIDPQCQHQIKDRCCDHSAKGIIDDIYLCSSHLKLKKYKDIKPKKIKKNKNIILNLGKNIVKLLDEKSNFLDVDIICIENQPALKNPTMKTIQMIIYTYFLIKGITSDKLISDIQMINARNKLKAYQGPPIECDIKDKYKKTKFLGIQYTEWMINHNSSVSDIFKTMFENSKKKDDLADAYLQGIYYLQTHKI
tara:strand:+ start:25 stop:705 length:681 start_codon:yes stop_codon:yes gene_type:complete